LKSTKRIKLIDLFSGAGGLTLGFKKALRGAMEPVWANDYNAAAAATYSANFGHCTPGDIIELLKTTKIPKADLVIGGPPCQGFSLLNKNKTADPRKQLWRPFIEVVLRSGAEVFVMENVPQLKDSPEHEEIVREAEEHGFQIASDILSAADYGVPQRRHRFFIIGCTFADPKTIFPPQRTHYNPSNGTIRSLFRLNGEHVDNPKPWRTVRDVIENLPNPEGTEIRKERPPLDLHFGRTPTSLSKQRYRAIPKEGMNRFDLQDRAPELTPACWIRKTSGGTDLFGRLWWDRPAFTIRTEFFKPEKGRYLHPVKHRPITHREAARLQTFPDSFKFCGSKIEIAKQIGNAVPPLLAASVADCVRELFRIRKKNVSDG
jgi:DNA (cytosine-5)-methyltransferase 1